MPDEPTSSLSMRQPLLIAVDEDRKALENLETQLNIQKEALKLEQISDKR